MTLLNSLLQIVGFENLGATEIFNAQIHKLGRSYRGHSTCSRGSLEEPGARDQNYTQEEKSLASGCQTLGARNLAQESNFAAT